MSTQPSLVQESVDRVSGAVDSINDEFQRVQKRVQKRRKTIEKQVKAQRRDFERETRKQVKKLQGELKKNSAMKRLRSAFDDAQKQIDKGLDTFLGSFRIASKADVARLDRKLGQINRKLKDLEKTRKSNGAALNA